MDTTTIKETCLEVTHVDSASVGHQFVYVFVREDLTSPQQAVQSCHSCIEAAKAFNFEKLQEHPSVIILSAKNEQKLQQIRKYLVDNGVQHVHFYEPDRDNELTSLATEPISGDRRKLFRKFQLIKEKDGFDPENTIIRYATKYEDGYYVYRSECNEKHNRTHYLAHAALSDHSWNHHENAQEVEVAVGHRVIRTMPKKGGA